jgi:hypothetical protein
LPTCVDESQKSFPNRIFLLYLVFKISANTSGVQNFRFFFIYLFLHSNVFFSSLKFELINRYTWCSKLRLILRVSKMSIILKFRINYNRYTWCSKLKVIHRVSKIFEFFLFIYFCIAMFFFSSLKFPKFLILKFQINYNRYISCPKLGVIV